MWGEALALDIWCSGVRCLRDVAKTFIKSNGKDKAVSSYIFESAFKRLLKICALSNCH